MSRPYNRFIVINAMTGPAHHPHVHSTIESAQMEAGRLAEQNPGVKFYVLQSLGYMQHMPGRWQPDTPTPDERTDVKLDVLSQTPRAYAKQDEPDGEPF